MKPHHLARLSGALAFTSLALAQTKAPDVAEFERRVRGGDKAVVGELIALAATNPKFIGEGFSKWQKPLLDDGQFDAVEKLSAVAIIEKPQAWPAVADAQRARALAMLGLGRFDQAVVEAKRYYNVCPLSKTDEAVSLLVQTLTAAGRGSEVKQLIAEQMADAKPHVDMEAALSTDEQPAGGVVGGIVLDAEPFKARLAEPLSGNVYEEWMARGNLLLLAGRPGAAKAFFRRAVEQTGKGGKSLQYAVEGVARSIRAQNANPARANAFVAQLAAGQ